MDNPKILVSCDSVISTFLIPQLSVSATFGKINDESSPGREKMSCSVMSKLKSSVIFYNFRNRMRKN